MIFPFVAIEGQGRIKKALLLNIINEKIGGVLISGEKGSAKSTLVRGLEKILTDKKVINLPLNITEDNLVGSIDIEKTLKTGKKVFQEGILKKCHNNILYIDEINLLGESIISTILEVVSREKNYIEREGISFSHDCKFILIGTMNPEEGDLRAGLLDKFGLYVNAESSKDILERVNIIKKRLEFEKNPIEFSKNYFEDEELLREKIFSAKKKLKKIKVSEQIMNIAAKFVEEANCLGNRAEIILIETAKAIAALDKRTYLNVDDLKEAATFVLPHRTNSKNELLPNEANKHNDNIDTDNHQTNTQTDDSMNNVESGQESKNNSQESDIQENENNLIFYWQNYSVMLDKTDLPISIRFGYSGKVKHHPKRPREDIKKAYLQVIEDLYDAGLRTLQVDDCTWGVLVDDNFLTAWGALQGKTKDQVRAELAELFLSFNNDLYQNVPAGLTVNTHVCRGNYHSTWASSGGYGPIAEELFEKEKVNAYFLEFDTERAGGFEPLAKVTPGKKVVLGLLTSKSGDLENKEEVIARIKEASQYVPLENLYLSTQCGFASTEEGNILTEESQWGKIALISDIVKEVWGE